MITHRNLRKIIFIQYKKTTITKKNNHTTIIKYYKKKVRMNIISLHHNIMLHFFYIDYHYIISLTETEDIEYKSL